MQYPPKDYQNWIKMKFAHISDTHLGQYRSKVDRENDTYDAFIQAVSKSIEAKVDFVILSGDIFDKSKPPNKAIVLLMQQLKLLKQNEAKFGFSESENRQFFRKGASNQWQDILNKDQILKIEQNFSKLMKKFGYKTIYHNE